MSFRAVLFDNNYYLYTPDSYMCTRVVKNTLYNTEVGHAFNIGGLNNPSHSITLALQNKTLIQYGNSVVGITVMMAADQLDRLRNSLRSTGLSSPTTFVAPDGLTYNVIAVGSFDYSLYNYDNLGNSSAEFRVSLSLENAT